MRGLCTFGAGLQPADYLIKTTAQFERDYKRIVRRGWAMDRLKTVMGARRKAKKLEPRYRNHKLTGSYAGRRECPIEPDWLLIYALTPTEILYERTGSHADLFE
ncbi:MAG TPA: type II toxin-antitoxin system YafQ family toxin [Anaerolineae bacterium]|nr:type II toxin-antitoxin system YafQ family toxin [Anaerolineae bacterium]HQH38681.1 type II toxin-antitoxin system YafQ family toxin [Anaerolineae bacterium]